MFEILGLCTPHPNAFMLEAFKPSTRMKDCTYPVPVCKDKFTFSSQFVERSNFKTPTVQRDDDENLASIDVQGIQTTR